jgi:NADH-quinone oxidoreductase subunit C
MSVSLQALADQLTRLSTSHSAGPPETGVGGEAAVAGLLTEMSDYGTRGYHLARTVPPDQVVAAARLLDQEAFALDTVTGVDWLAAAEMEVIYDYFHPRGPWRVVIRARIPRAQPEIPTVSAVFPGANWHERETHDFLGIRFVGHPQLTPLLLPEDADYHPLRKDFAA